jgi:hypothetical protein
MNLVIGDEVNLRLFSWNSNHKTNVYQIQTVNIFFFDPNEKNFEHPNGTRLVQTFSNSDIQQNGTGEYYIQVTLQPQQYLIGHYKDVWTVQLQSDDPATTIWENHFRIYPNLWYMAPEPLVYDFSFFFRPNKLRLGSKQYLIITIKPNVPHASDLERYYMDLAINSPLKIWMVQTCGHCLPESEDERTVIDGDLVVYRDKCEAWYLLDTRDMKVGIYDIHFEMLFGDCIYISNRQQLQLY